MSFTGEETRASLHGVICGCRRDSAADVKHLRDVGGGRSLPLSVIRTDAVCDSNAVCESKMAKVRVNGKEMARNEGGRTATTAHKANKK